MWIVIPASDPESRFKFKIPACAGMTFCISSNCKSHVQIFLSFPKNDVNISSVANGGFFPDYNYAIDSANGRIEIHAGYLTIGDLGGTTSGTGNLATFNVQTSKTSGSGTISFVCSSSDILDANGNNILNCGSSNQLAITYSSGNPNNTPTPTPTPTLTPTPTPTLPKQKGIFLSLRDGFIGLIFLIIAGFLYWKFKKPSPPTPPPSSPTPFPPPAT